MITISIITISMITIIIITIIIITITTLMAPGWFWRTLASQHLEVSSVRSALDHQGCFDHVFVLKLMIHNYKSGDFYDDYDDLTMIIVMTSGSVKYEVSAGPPRLLWSCFSVESGDFCDYFMKMKTHFIFPLRFQTDIKLVEVQVVGEIHIRKEKQLQCALYALYAPKNV